MKKWMRLLSLILSLVIILSVTAGCGKSKDESEDDPTDSEVAADPDDAADENFIDLQENLSARKVKDEASAIAAVVDSAEDLGFESDDLQVVVTDVSTVGKETYYRMQQTYNDVPVYGKEVILVADSSGKAISISSNMAHISNGATGDIGDVSSIDYKKLLDWATSILQSEEFSFLNFKCISQPETVYYPVGSEVRPCFKDIISFDDANGRNYAFEILFDCNSYQLVDIDLVGVYGSSVKATGKDVDGVEWSFNAYQMDNSYYMYDADKDIMVVDAQDNTVVMYPLIVDDNGVEYTYDNGVLYDENNKAFYLNDDYDVVDESGRVVGRDIRIEIGFTATPDEDGLVVSSSSSTEWDDDKAVTALSRVQNVYDFYDNVLGRESFDGYGSPIRVFYNDYFYGDSSNAYSCTLPDMTALSFGTYNNISFDCVGHEFTHSVVNSIVDLPYRNQSGALNEAYADIFGEIVEDYADGKLDNSCDWMTDVYRNHIDPLSTGNPEKFRGKKWNRFYAVPEFFGKSELQEWLDSLTDTGGIHQNSTVISHAAYLMNNGIDGDENKKIDTEMLAQIFYRSIFYMHSDETFKECAKHIYYAAALTEGITDDQFACVVEALDMVGLPVE